MGISPAIRAYSGAVRRRGVTALAAALFVGAFLAVQIEAGRTPVAAAATVKSDIAWKDGGVRLIRPSVNYGSQTSAVVSRSGSWYYAAFNTQAPTGAASVVTSAVLYLTPLRNTAGSLEAYAVPGDTYGWEESSLTWTNQPAKTATVLGRSTEPLVAGRRIAIRLMPSALTAGDTDVRIALAGTPGTNSVATDEHPTAAYRPQLVVTYGPAAPVASPAPTQATPAAHTLTGVTRYVSASGSDSGDGSISRPWRSWVTGLTKLRALGGGHTLVLRGGVYAEDFTGESPKGTPSAPVRVTSYPGEVAVVRGLTRLYNPDYLTVDHLVFESAAGDDPTQHMFRLTNGIGWVVENNEFRNLRTFAAIHVTTWQRTDRPAAAQIRNNVFRDQVDARPAVNNNTQHFVYAGVGATGSLQVRRNLFYRSMNTGGAVKIGPDSPGAVDLSYNTFSANAPHAILFENVVNNTKIYRNIFAGSGASHVQLWDYSGNGSLLSENLWQGTSLLTSGGSTTSAERGELVGAGNIAADPQFVDPSRGDFRPRNPAASGYGKYAP